MHKPHIAILAAGKGKRMKSRLPKVLHPVLFRPMIHHVLDLAKALPHSRIFVIVGHGEDQVRQACSMYENIEFVQQKEQKGTAHAVMQLEPQLGKEKGQLLILSGDVILLKLESMQRFLQVHEESQACASLVTTELSNPTGYGRILKTGQNVLGIREEADASTQEKMIREINAGIYSFDIPSLFSALSKISDKNKQKEFYLTDTIDILNQKGSKVLGHLFPDFEEILGINDRMALSEAERVLQSRINEKWMREGVTLHHPATTKIDPRCQLAADTTVEPGVVLVNTKVGEGSHIEAFSRIENSTLENDVYIRQGSYINGALIGRAAVVGPYAHLRAGSELGPEVKIGNFVEVKKARFGSGSKASHLSYIGDAEIGQNVNLGCGFITCNYDGVKKHKTIVEDEVFVGSDSQTVAPVRIGKGSYIASGSTITKDVPADSLALSRGRQIIKPGYAKKFPRE
jgi:bifunctional UDP-N-acetylglucosamine pyrophosphorylase / glucosamine-1-phosphate N-acetyltransferase